VPSRQKLVVPGVDQSLNQFKAEIAEEFGLQQNERNVNEDVTRKLLKKANRTKE